MIGRALAGALAALLVAAPAAADPQIAAGGSITLMQPRDSRFGERRVTAAPVVRLVPRKGLGVSWGLSWFESEFDLEALGGPAAAGRLHIRPVMIGASYTFGGEQTLVSISTVGGYAINTLKLLDETRRGPGEASVSHSPAVRPGIGLWRYLHPRVGLTFFGGYVFARPAFTLDGPNGRTERRIKADYATVSAGAAVVLF